jgi:DNA repair exonuclease SbcCD ATPase subunit
VLDGASTEIAALREEAAELNGRIRARADAAVEEAWQEAAEKLGAAQRRVAALEREVALLTRLRTALEAARAEARDHYFAPVMTELRPLLGLLFEDATVTFDEETLLPRTVSRNGLEEPVGVLSGGMREQLAVLTRLAFARLLAKDGQPAPVILDDALVYSDDDRIERMFDALHRQASGQQIIVFSCRQRAFAQLGGTILRMVPWVPEG